MDQSDRAQRPERWRQLFARAQRLDEEGLHDDAATAYEELLRLEPRHAPAWFNLSLIHKQSHRWPELMACCRRVLALDPSDEGARWNLGIAATALRDWPAARAAWRAYGLTMPVGEGPPDLNYGLTPIRLNPADAAEVVWCRRVDPARAVVESVPFPDSRHRWHDVLLHDGEPRGERTLSGQPVPVFDELERWEPSDTPTLTVALEAPDREAVEALVEVVRESGWAAEDWSSSVRMLCQECSRSRVEGEGAAASTWQTHRHVGIAAPPAVADRLLDAWARADPGRAHGPARLAF
jgi:hypothetical protein